MQSYSTPYTASYHFTDLGYRPPSSTPTSYLSSDGFSKPTCQNPTDKYKYDSLIYSKGKENLFTQPGLSKKPSLDLMKKSIYPSFNLKDHSLQQDPMEKSLNQYKRMEPSFLDKTNTHFSNKPYYSRKSLNFNSLSNIKPPVKPRRSYNYSSQENIISPELKEYFMDKYKTPESKNQKPQNHTPKSHHKRNSSSSSFSSANQPMTQPSPRRSFAIKRTQQNYSSFFYQKNLNLSDTKKVEKSFPTYEPLSLKNDSDVDVSFQSQESIREAEIQETARFNVSEETKNSKIELKVIPKLEKQVTEPKKRLFQLQNFVLGPCKGKGRYGKVYLAVEKQTGFLCALKQISLEVVKGMLAQFISELKIQFFLESPYINKTYGYFIQNDNIYLIMEYMTDGNLYERIKKKGPIPEKRAAMKLHQISQGLKHMHHFSVIHRDLKPQNIVMSFDVCKICDFSWATKCDQRRQTNCGTLDYLSPEMISGEGYSNSIDLWAMGVLLYEMLVGKPPFYNSSIKQTTKRIKECTFTLPESLSKQAKQLIECFLQRNPDQRKQIDEIIRHAFFRNVQEQK